jgi:uncharacterized protein (DUF58 family)
MNPKPKIEFRRRLPFLWLILLAILAVLLPSRVWNTLLIGLGGMLVGAYIWARLLARGLKGSRRLRFGWVAVGDRLSEHFEIRNDSLLSAIWVEVVDQSNMPGYRPAVVRSVGVNEIDSWRQSAICQQRGQFSLGPWALHTADPLGIFRVTIPYPITNEIVIHPPIHTQLPIPLPAGQSSGRAKARERSWQATINAATVREYQTHDPLHWIHWPSTARHDDLFVRQFDLDAAGDIWLVLDMQAAAQLGQGPEGTEEHAVLLAAALSAQALHQNRAVGLATYGREPQIITPGRGQGQQWRLLRALALVTADGESDLSLALRDAGRVARRGSAAVVITSSGQADWLPNLLNLAQRGIRAHVILFDRPTFVDQGAGATAGSSRGLHDAIRQLGFTCHLISQGQVGQPAEDQARRGFWEFKVTGTGKVITSRSPFEG